jgi:hypothetical protein
MGHDFTGARRTVQKLERWQCFAFPGLNVQMRLAVCEELLATK